MKRKKARSTSPTLFPTRVCKVCGKEKILVAENFGPTNDHCFLWTCRECVATYCREYRKNKVKKEITDEDRIPPENDGTRFRICTKCRASKLEIDSNFRWLADRKNFRSSCRQCDCGYSKSYANRHKKQVLDKQHKYVEENRDILNEKKRQRRKEDKTKDDLYWNSPAKFKTHANKLTIEEDPIADENGYLLAKCAYCGQYFYPTNRAILHRTSSLNNIGFGERRLYCSQGCKKACPIYGRQDFPKGYKKASSREVDPLVRQLCLKRDNYTCQRCGALITEAELHAHHIEGAVQQPMLANDVENTITLCKKCHKWVHSQEGCRYFDLRCK